MTLNCYLKLLHSPFTTSVVITDGYTSLSFIRYRQPFTPHSSCKTANLVNFVEILRVCENSSQASSRAQMGIKRAQLFYPPQLSWNVFTFSFDY